MLSPSHPFAVPVLVRDQLLGILFVQNPDGAPVLDAHARAAVTRHVEAAITLAQGGVVADASAMPEPLAGPALRVHYFRKNSSIFIDGCYLVKGVAGAILWQLLGDFSESGRQEFSNRELRLLPALRLPETSHNLEVRLSLLQRRLEEHGKDLRMEKTARGKFRLAVTRPVELLAS